MSTYQVKHYDVRMSVKVGGIQGCCGGNSLYGFVVEGNTSSLSKEQKEKMYDALWIELSGGGDSRLNGTMVAMDALLDFGEWDDLHRSGGTDASQWVTDENCGDISLEDFCRHHGFEFVGQAKNRNSGNIVGAMVKAVRAVSKDDPDGTPDIYKVPTPDFSDDKTASAKKSTSTADTAAVIASLQEAIARSRQVA